MIKVITVASKILSIVLLIVVYLFLSFIVLIIAYIFQFVNSFFKNFFYFWLSLLFAGIPTATDFSLNFGVCEIGSIGDCLSLCLEVSGEVFAVLVDNSVFHFFVPLSFFILITL
jgi:hypothetical protein